MSGSFNIGVSALLSFQRALGTIGHNIANVNTPGYSRQEVSLSANPPEFSGAGFIGSGVGITSIRRVYDGFVVEQLRNNQTAYTQQQTFFDLSSQIDGLLGDTATSLSAGLQGFFDSVQQVADDPTSTAAREVMLTEGQTLVSRFRQLNQNMDDLRGAMHNQIRTTVAEINSLAAGVAEINEKIVAAVGQSSGDLPNDLLDQRDEMIEELAQRVAVTTVAQNDGAVNVFIGTGQSLVVGTQSSTLAAAQLGTDPQQLDVGVVTQGATIPITDFIQGGSLGALYDFTDKVLDPSKNALGQIAVGLASAFNDQHQLGMDLDGVTGRDFFTVPSIQVIANTANSGPGPVSVAYDDVTQLTTDEYQLSYDGANWTLTRESDGQTVPFTSGTGVAGDPFIVDGMSIVTDPAAVAGDRYLIHPTRNGAAQIDVALTENSQIAAAGSHYSEAAAANTGDATISPAQVLDPSDPALLTPVSIVFDTDSSFMVNGGPSSIAYTSGADIDVNGLFRVQISGTPQAGDTFTVDPNFGGVGDNGNALLLANMQQSQILAGGTASFNDAYSAVVADVGTKTRQAEINALSQEQLLEQSQQTRESVSGVNLDEEAADMLQFEQAYQAAAQVIAVADTLFEELINAVRR